MVINHSVLFLAGSETMRGRASNTALSFWGKGIPQISDFLASLYLHTIYSTLLAPRVAERNSFYSSPTTLKITPVRWPFQYGALTLINNQFQLDPHYYVK